MNRLVLFLCWWFLYFFTPQVHFFGEMHFCTSEKIILSLIFCAAENFHFFYPPPLPTTKCKLIWSVAFFITVKNTNVKNMTKIRAASKEELAIYLVGICKISKQNILSCTFFCPLLCYEHASCYNFSYIAQWTLNICWIVRNNICTQNHMSEHVILTHSKWNSWVKIQETL